MIALFWIAAGLLTGALAHGARWGQTERGFAPRGAWAAMLGLGAAGAVAGGLIGAFLAGRPMSLGLALTFGALASAGAPWVLARLPRPAREAGAFPPEAASIAPLHPDREGLG